MTDASLDGSGVEGGQREAAPFNEHMQWLAQQKREFEEHQAAHNNGSDAGSQVNAFAVGSGPECAFDDEMPVYRSFSMMADDEHALSALADDEAPVYRSLSTALAGASVDEQPVYRGVDLSAVAVSSNASSNAPPEDAHTSWAAMGRPPMLRRQNAFRVSSSEDPTWMGLFNANGNETGR